MTSLGLLFAQRRYFDVRRHKAALEMTVAVTAVVIYSTLKFFSSNADLLGMFIVTVPSCALALIPPAFGLWPSSSTNISLLKLMIIGAAVTAPLPIIFYFFALGSPILPFLFPSCCGALGAAVFWLVGVSHDRTDGTT